MVAMETAEKEGDTGDRAAIWKAFAGTKFC